MQSPAVPWTTAAFWPRVWLAGCSSRTTGRRAPEPSYFTQKVLRHRQSRHCACKTPPTLREGSTAPVSHLACQSGLSKQAFFPCLSGRSAFKFPALKRTTRSFGFFFMFLQSPYTTPPAETVSSSSRLPVAPGLPYAAGYRLIPEQTTIPFIMLSFRTLLLPDSYYVELMT